MELKRRSVRWSLESRDLPLRVCFWRRVILCRARPPPSPTGHIPSPVHFAERQSRVSAGFLSPPAGMVGVASSGRTMGHGRAAFTCGCWCLRSGVCEGPRHDSPSASEWLGGSCTRLWALPCWPCLGVEAAPLDLISVGGRRTCPSFYILARTYISV